MAIRFDIDALGLVEDSTDGHYPKQEGFSSCHLERCMLVDMMVMHLLV